MLVRVNVAVTQINRDNLCMGVDDREKPKTIAISPAAHAKFARACETRAVSRSMVDAASRLIDWFCRQEPLVQTAIMADVDRGMEAAYAEALEALAVQLRGGDIRATREIVRPLPRPPRPDEKPVHRR